MLVWCQEALRVGDDRAELIQVCGRAPPYLIRQALASSRVDMVYVE